MGEDTNKIQVVGETVLSDEQRLYVCKRIGEFTSSEQILKELRETYGAVCTLPNISWYRKALKWRNQILAFRKSYIEKIEEVPLSHKKVRLVELQHLFNSLKSYDGKILIHLQKNALDIIKQAQSEIEVRPEIYQGIFALISGDKVDKILGVEVLRVVEQLEREIEEGSPTPLLEGEFSTVTASITGSPEKV